MNNSVHFAVELVRWLGLGDFIGCEMVINIIIGILVLIGIIQPLLL